MEEGRKLTDAVKRCSKCEQKKPLAEFYRHARNPDGLQYWCKVCTKADNRRRYIGNPELRARMTESTRRWRAANPDTARKHGREAQRRYYGRRREAFAQRTDEEIAARRAVLRPDGLKTCRRCRSSIPLDSFTIDRSRPDGLRDSCRACHNDGLLRIAATRWADDDLYACVYCDAPFEAVDHVWARRHGGPDAEINLVPACTACNTSKKDASVIEFVARRLGREVVDAVTTWPVRVVDMGGCA